jgi:hypothetical protein
VDGITLTIVPQFNVNTRIRTEGFAVETLYNKGIRAALEWFGARAPYEATPVNAIASETFPLFRLSPGSYRLSVTRLPADYYVKEARLGQQDILGQTIELNGPVSGTLDLLISNRSGLIEGTVVDARQVPAAYIEAVLIPETQRDRFDLYKRATADENGRFKILGIPPGSYRLFAWETSEPLCVFRCRSCPAGGVARQTYPCNRVVERNCRDQKHPLSFKVTITYSEESVQKPPMRDRPPIRATA